MDVKRAEVVGRGQGKWRAGEVEDRIWGERAIVQFQSAAKPDAADVGLDFIAVWGAKGVSVYTVCSIEDSRSAHGGGCERLEDVD